MPAICIHKLFVYIELKIIHHFNFRQYSQRQKNFDGEFFLIYGRLSYSTIVLHSRDHKGVGMAHEKYYPKISLTFPDDNEAELVR